MANQSKLLLKSTLEKITRIHKDPGPSSSRALMPGSLPIHTSSARRTIQPSFLSTQRKH
jgi:hypothetical protein